MIRYEVSTGTPGQVRAPLRRAVAAYVRRRPRFTIGRTAHPRPRFAAYPGAEQMILVYETRSIRYADRVERDLTEWFPDASNMRRGGGGPEAISPRHYVYVVVW